MHFHGTGHAVPEGTINHTSLPIRSYSDLHIILMQCDAPARSLVVHYLIALVAPSASFATRSAAVHDGDS